jgi:pSer/pThr/pTyr-binding forkhead associated (FHA) protein
VPGDEKYGPDDYGLVDVNVTAEVTTTMPQVPAQGSLQPGRAPYSPTVLPPRMALLVVTQGPNAGARFLLDLDVITAGRSVDSDIFLDDVTVSRAHAEFRRSGDSFAIVDLGSLNGTYVNGERVDQARLRGGDTVQIGRFHLVLRMSGPPAA